ncbi:carbon starvation protein A [Sulfurospirillum sp. T05]|uniref:Carbon starvation protein A n=1 Tax=Sulfurospirillum tamanense TaxID=2813362 RepID=A0ABS2WVG4_9BACT|nr:carbon starvation protein A [Sulfurospirillum tamanensis]MBN2965578.1 carbon starvation protein A [Sulfurospirillum tamanensis]
MNAMVLLLLGLAGLAGGFFLYSKFIAERILKLSADFKTPAHEFEDGIDFVPTNKYVLWGHHFTSVAGAAPIVGPAIAVIWGWLPAFIWVIVGTIFLAGVHDMSAIWASVRNKGQSIASIAGKVLSPKARSLMMVVVFLLLLMVNAAFAVVIANMMVATPSAVVPVWGALVVAFIIGQAIYKYKLNLPVVSLVGVVALYLLILIGPSVPVSLPDSVFGMTPHTTWIIILFTYAAIASMLPVWMLLQPRDYINGLQLFIGLGLLYFSFIVVAPDVVAPMFNTNTPEGTPSLVPLLFVTIACGAISGFHGLVSTGTTSKQLNNEKDARFVGYFGSVGEGLLALAAILAATAGFATLADWEAMYSGFGKGGVAAFVQGGGAIMSEGIGISPELSATVLTVMAALFAGTTMDTGVRLQRYIFQEWGDIYNLNVLKKGWVATLFAVGACLLLAFGAGGMDGRGGMIIWPLFGTTNQLMAGLTLLIVTVMLMRQKSAIRYTLIPLIFLLSVTFVALLIQLVDFYNKSNWLLIIMDLIILGATILVTLEGISVLKREWKKNAPQI